MSVTAFLAPPNPDPDSETEHRTAPHFANGKVTSNTHSPPGSKSPRCLHMDVDGLASRVASTEDCKRPDGCSSWEPYASDYTRSRTEGLLQARAFRCVLSLHIDNKNGALSHAVPTPKRCTGFVLRKPRFAVVLHVHIRNTLASGGTQKMFPAFYSTIGTVSSCALYKLCAGRSLYQEGRQQHKTRYKLSGMSIQRLARICSEPDRLLCRTALVFLLPHAHLADHPPVEQWSALVPCVTLTCPVFGARAVIQSVNGQT
eukprot:2434737-Rhodomonas_salina.2